ncbi:bifunctional enoyl-CoA hydratase/phosphate acetyltransferase [Roseiarcaceae bacterium H3SJ34-1]|uniref:bifunctional enoyl-CoA hydratase/phosphate acetyltransferase n=1 Tax=Terripilifer ovatus TaxID=3032367 RepID=UPI003AB9B3F2|nr:bifunctional enoyl-CoA hydratase/phosphate acetyltransferase [Roseiarcaceae bacterium H3SJ34-1]
MAALSHRNTTFDELAVGQTASIERSVTADDLYVFAYASGNTNPMHMPGADVDQDGHADTVAPSLWVGALVSSVLGTILPGAGTLYRSQTFQFKGRAKLGDRLIISVRCIEKREKPRAVFETRVEKSDGTLILEGVGEIEAPIASVVLPKRQLPLLMLDRHEHFSRLVQRCRRLAPMPTAVVCPDDANSLGGVMLSMQEGLIAPFLIGARGKIQRAADAAEVDISALPLIDIEDHSEAAKRAVAMVNAREVRAIMKGNVHSDELLGQVVKKDGGLRGTRRISHVFVMDAPTRSDLIFISDAAINIAPDLTTKVDIVQNAIDLAIACGLTQAKVGILAAVETVNVNMPSTLEAAALAKMADRGQITGALVDGPLAMDNAVDVEAARTKGIVSTVAGHADVLIVPNLEAGNMLAKQLTFVARAEAAGLVVGAGAPIILTSRADNDKSRVASCAVAQLYDYWRQHGEPLLDVEAVPEAAE